MKEESKGEIKEQRNYRTARKQWTAIVGPCILTIILYVNALNFPIKGHRVTEWITKNKT